MTQLGLEGMPKRLFACTPSRLTAWGDCPRRYRMTYLDRPAPQKGPPWAHNTVGAVVHLALARWWGLPRERRHPAAARGLVDAAWKTDGFSDDAQAEQWRARAGDMVQGYAATLDPDDEPLGVERTVSVKSPALAVSGRVDRIDLRDGEVVVVDYKTGRSTLTQDDARGSLALALYALACARTLRRSCVAVELHHLPTGRVLRWEHTQEGLDRHLRRAEALGQEAVAATEALQDGADADALFPARPGRQCGGATSCGCARRGRRRCVRRSSRGRGSPTRCPGPSRCRAPGRASGPVRRPRGRPERRPQRYRPSRSLAPARCGPCRIACGTTSTPLRNATPAAVAATSVVGIPGRL